MILQLQVGEPKVVESDIRSHESLRHEVLDRLMVLGWRTGCIEFDPDELAQPLSCRASKHFHRNRGHFSGITVRRKCRASAL